MRRALLILLLGLPLLGCSSDDESASTDTASSNSGTVGSTTGTSGVNTTSTATSGGGGSQGATSASTADATSDSTTTGDATSTGGSDTSGSTSTDGESTSSGGADATGAGGSTTTMAGGGTGGGGSSSDLGFFVSSDTSATGNLGGIEGADARCQALAEAVGAGDRTWRAYLSTETENARDRIGGGPWINSAGVTLANDLDELHSITGDPELFLDENGERINGQWEGSPTPNQHDILTGSDADGMLMAGSTCDDWTSDSGDLSAQIGHSDGLGPNQNGDPPYSSWNSAHANGGCDDTAPLGGAGRIYCFAAD